MALSGSFETSHRSYTNYPNRAYFKWSGTQSTSGNYTDISWSFTLGGGTSSTASIAIYSGSVTVDGETHSFNYANSGYKKNGFVLASGTKRIYHNGDGTKSFSASGGVNIYGSSEYYSGSGSWTLNSIPRKATITSAPNFDDEANPTITYENKAGNSANSLMACISLTSAADDIAYRDISKTGSSYTFNLTEAERNVLRGATTTANSRDVYFFVRTVIGNNTFHDYKKVTLTIVNGNPTFSNFTYQDTNSTITGITGNNQVLVQGKSTLRVTVASANKATAKKSATMSNYLASISGLSETGAYSSSADVVMNFASKAFTAGAQSLSVKATDSRGNFTSVSKSVTVLAYADPVVNATAERLNNFESTTTLAISGSFSPLQVSGTAKNTIQSVQYRYKASTTSTWGSWTTAGGLSVNTNGTYTVSNITLNLNNQNAYDFEVKTTDKVGSKTVSLSVSQGQPQFFVGTDGRVGIGGLPNISLPSGNLGQLEVMGDVYANGNKLLMTLDRVYPVGSIYMSATHSTADAVAEALGGGTWVAWGAGRVPVGVDANDTDFDTAEETGGEKTHKLTTSEMPKHRHLHGQVYSGYHLYQGGSAPNGVYTGYAVSDPTSYEGGDGAHNNLQPYITVYMWKRTA